MATNEIRISVRELIEFVLRSGDIKSVFLSSSRAVDGIKAHQKIQKRFAKQYDKYQAEVPIGDHITMEDITLELSGRIDGIIEDEQLPIIDEIKSVVRDLSTIDEDYNQLHWAQGKMYAYMYAKEHALDTLVVQLTYVELGSYAIKQFQKTYTKQALEAFYLDTIRLYITFAKQIAQYNALKDKSIKSLQFPFTGYRRGQRKLVTSVYKVIIEGEKLYARAPTGIGKTMGTLFPAIKSLAEQPGKIFYLTAKTIGRDVAEKALNLLEDHGLIMKRVMITAKDKVCLHHEKKCDGDFCPYAKGHFDRINDALSAMMAATHHYSRDVILEYATRYQVCPYELTLDVSLFCDCIICDYNYAFDPSAVLKRFFVEGNGRYIFLIDEAHNLVDRARSMYSAVMSKKAILELKKKVKGKDNILHGYLNKINQFMIEKRHACDDRGYVVDDYYSEDLVDLLRGVLFRTEKIFPQLNDWEHMDALLEFYFDTYDFVKKIELYDDRYVTYYEKLRDEVRMKIYCLDPSFNLKTYMDNAKAAVLFSATLTPMDYFVKILGGHEKNYGLTLESPFESDNLCLLVNNTVSTKYKDRERTYDQVVDTIRYTVGGKKGNYMVFFPSYQYMEDVSERFIAGMEDQSTTVMCQERGLSEKEKEDFLQAFHEEREHTLVAFAVLGGMFGEGIDLKGEKLSGAIIVGVGLPSICLERDLIKAHFDNRSGNGFQYAYMYPGMNKVMQAAGRVIRTGEDIGVVILIDERFNYQHYRNLFPPEWCHAKYISSSTSLRNRVDLFWNKGCKKV
ncbi:ATP-dependent DNA helicase [Vallitalea pronyensis]|uniref:ATP-dependent DNA helicase n=1 Tax=Vallitalea pronyensis TaxID=1348613 RepID=A0A8J8MFU7_9FIRM|nr:ATP-dependent DNA helicase [Vallitalea pronyensis]QUI20814.1 ATP-dependent DNA helicase [Vallitalea pronyensis]